MASSFTVRERSAQEDEGPQSSPQDPDRRATLNQRMAAMAMKKKKKGKKAAKKDAAK
jgi:hypothetical protein